MRPVAALAGLFLALVGCNLSEAERMDLSRGEILTVEPEQPVVLFRGGQVVRLTEFVQSLRTGDFDRSCTVDWGDRGTSPGPIEGFVDVYVGDELLVGYDPWTGQRRVFDGVVPQVLQTPEAVRFELNTGGMEPSSEPGLRLVDDRPSLAPAVTGWDGIRQVSRGDTLVVEAHNPLAAPLEVWSDHQGLRTLGAYFTTLAPGGTVGFRWVVTATSGAEGWVELGWGEWGQTRRFRFLVR